MNFGTSDAARLLERTRKAIYQRCDNSITLSRSEATEAVFDAWQSNDEAWKLCADEVVPDPVLPKNPNHANIIGYPLTGSEKLGSERNPTRK